MVIMNGLGIVHKTARVGEQESTHVAGRHCGQRIVVAPCVEVAVVGCTSPAVLVAVAAGVVDAPCQPAGEEGRQPAGGAGWSSRQNDRCVGDGQWGS